MEFNWQGPWNLAVDQGRDVGERNFLPTLSLFLPGPTPCPLPTGCPAGAPEKPRARGSDLVGRSRLWGRNSQAEGTARGPASCGFGEGPGTWLGLGSTGYGIVAGRGTPLLPPQTQNHTADGVPENTFTRTLGVALASHSSKAPAPNKHPALGCPGQGHQLGSVAPKVAAGSVERKGLGWHKAEGHEAGEWGASSPGGKGHGTDTEVG